MTTEFEPRPPSRRKNTRRWCKGKVGVEHQTVIELDARYMRNGWSAECHPSFSGFWWCNHHEVCTVCSKIVNPFPGCPDRSDGGESAAPLPGS